LVRLLADENIQAPLVAALRQAGHDGASIAEEASGITDDEVVAFAAAHHRYLLTEDKDFGELVFRLNKALPGVILVRVSDVLWQTRNRRLSTLFSHHSGRLEGNYVVVEDDRIRFRSMR
jgi:predicted nuclease of predicted toxin-antitoxin system